MRPDGSGQHPLTSGEDESAADFSPDGRSIAFVGFTGGNADLWIMRADGTGRRRLTSSPMFEYDPRWSPDGRWIAFEGYTRDFPDLFLIDRNGRDRRRLTDTGKYAGNAAWRPNDKE
jgi:Tol biopolymer transport system component